MIAPTRALLEAALEGYKLQRMTIELREREIRAVLNSPVEKLVEEADANYERKNNVKLDSPLYVAGATDPTKSDKFWRSKKTALINAGTIVDVTSHGSSYPPRKPKKRHLSAAGRAAISRATKARWAKYRKEKKRG